MDLRRYDDLAGGWWRWDGAFAVLRWLAQARGALIPSRSRPEGQFLDLGCGGGLLALYVSGCRHVGVDLSALALEIAAHHGARPVYADVIELPFEDGSFDVVVAGDPRARRESEADGRGGGAGAAAGGTLVFDTINSTLLARILLVTIGERMPGGSPPGCHDARLFVSADWLRRLFETKGIALRMWGLRPKMRQ